MISYGGSTTGCIWWNDTHSLSQALNNLDSLQASVPIEVTQSIIPNGFKYKITFASLAPTPLLSPPTALCGNASFTQIYYSKDMAFKMIFRYIIEDEKYTN